MTASAVAQRYHIVMEIARVGQDLKNYSYISLSIP